MRFGNGPISKLWFNSIDRSIKSFVVFAGWLFERSSSSSGNGRLVLGRSSSSSNGCLALGRSSSSGNGRLVLAMVLCWLLF